MNKKAQVIIVCSNLNEEMEFFVKLGFKMGQIFPADNPQVLVLSGFGLLLRLVKGDQSANIAIQLPKRDVSDQSDLISPNGVKIQFSQALKVAVDRPKNIEFSLNKFNANKSWITGRAGMLYRDLIPDRLGGAIIASNIMIPEGGPVPDHVHYHSIQFQMIFCVKGWVKVVYEDQGEPFVLKAGDCVTQPPEIRHQVLESSDGLEVVEIGLPAEHMTTLDDQMSLPTGADLPDRIYKGQRFCHHINDQATWEVWQNTDLLKCQTSVLADSAGVAAVNVFKSGVANTIDADHQAIILQHQDVFRFYYVMAGQTKASNQQGINTELNERDSFLLPAGQSLQLSDLSADFQCIEFVLMN
ncbi:MAG: cupin domain-containing protein [Alcanivoracaceae bacterium]|nr:cupin domain-containing protein [Alcanivoracaceae bacterium]